MGSMERGRAFSVLVFLLILLLLSSLSQLHLSLGVGGICCTGPFASYLSVSGLTQELENPL